MLPKGATSRMSWRSTWAPPQPLGFRCCCEHTKASWFCSAVRCWKTPFHLKYQNGSGKNRPHVGPGDRSRALMSGCSQPGGLWLFCAQRHELAAAAGAGPRHAGVREELSQLALNSWISPPRGEEQHAKGFQKAGKAKSTASHSSRISSCFFSFPVSCKLELRSNSPVPNHQKH